MKSTVRLTRSFVDRWAGEYDQRYAGTGDDLEERYIKAWIRRLPAPKYLDRSRFIRLGRWKTPRQIRAYESNAAEFVKETTMLAFQTRNDLLKLYILTALRGVSETVAATILHFVWPHKFPIFDIRARTTLKSAGRWNRSLDDTRPSAWQDYVAIMRDLAKQLEVSLRKLDKALYAYDRWG